jgi:inorganic pyrophosphatase
VHFPDRLDVVIEVPRGGFIKRKDDGSVDFVSPLPCPFNYGSVPDTRSGDGDRLDAVVLGPRLPRGTQVRARVQGQVHFTDAGEDDPKLICGETPLTRADRVRIRAFFWCYARAKALLNRARGKPGHTRYGGLHEPVY